MNQVDFLMENYYAKAPKDIIPTPDQLVIALNEHPDKVVTLLIGGKIVGMAVFLKLTDKTYAHLEDYDLRNLATLKELVKQNGRNVHFVMVAGKHFNHIRLGIKTVIKEIKPKTVSWWSPDFSRLHKYEVR